MKRKHNGKAVESLEIPSVNNYTIERVSREINRKGTRNRYTSRLGSDTQSPNFTYSSSYYNGMNVTATLLPSEEEQLFIGSCDCTESDWDSMTDEERGNLLCEGVVGYMDKSLVATDRV